MKVLWFLILLLYTAIISTGVVFAETAPEQSWIARYNGPANGSDNAIKIATDASGNIYVTGDSRNEITGSSDYATVKYDADGNQLWVARYDNGKYENVADLAVDALGNVYVTGSSRSDTADFATVKYDTNGNQLWVARYDSGSKNEDSPNAIAVDNLGNVHVTGYSHIHSPYHVPYNSYTTVKYDTNGNQLWVTRYDSGIDNTAYALFVDSSGSVYVTGKSQGVDYDYLTVKYNTNGAQLWSARYDSGGSDQARTLAVDVSGNVYVGGDSNGYTIIKYNASGAQLWKIQSGLAYNAHFSVDALGNIYVPGQSYNGTNGDYAITKYDTNGVQLWVAQYDSGSSDIPSALIVDASGNVYVTGGTYYSGVNNDYLTVKYNVSGNQLWATRYNNGGLDYAVAITMDTVGNVYVTGSSYGIGTYSDYATLKYSSATNPTILLPGILGSWTNDFFEPFTNPNPIAQNKLSLTEESRSWAWQQLDALGYLPHSWELPKTFLPTLGYKTYKCPYDWRNTDTYNAELYLMPCIDKAKQETGASKVNIVAHSMGGLVARAYIQNDALFRNDVNKLALLGTPNHGSPEAYYFWEGADLTRGWFGLLGTVTEKVLGNTLFKIGARITKKASVAYAHLFFPSVQELLPTFDYLKDQFGNVRDTLDMTWQNEFVSNLNAQSNISRLYSSVDTKVFAGEGYDTLENIKVLYPNPNNILGSKTSPYPDGQPIPLLEDFNPQGDKTVLSQKSAKIQETVVEFQTKTKIVGNEAFLEHTNLPNSFFLETASFLGTTATTTSSYSPSLPKEMFAISLASPANLLIVDPKGKKLGFDASSQTEKYEISEGIYSGQDELELAAVVNPMPGIYKVYVSGTGSGEFHTGLSYAKEGCTGLVEQENIGQIATGTVAAFTVEIKGGCMKDAVTYSLDSVIKINPGTLNLSSKGNGITAYIELPDLYKAEDIDVSTITLNSTISALSSPAAVGDYNNNGIKDLMVKFERSEVQKMVAVGINELTVSGNLSDGTMFAGKSVLNVISNPPPKKFLSFFDFLFVLLSKFSLVNIFSSFK